MNMIQETEKRLSEIKNRKALKENENQHAWATGALSSINGAARLMKDASPTPTNLKGWFNAFMIPNCTEWALGKIEKSPGLSHGYQNQVQIWSSQGMES